jgi:hypothetical protein
MRADGVNRTLEGDPVGLTLQALLARTRGEYRGTVGSLLGELRQGNTNNEVKLPTSPRGLSDRLRRLAPAFRLLGTEIRLLGHGREGSQVSITKADQQQDGQEPSSTSHHHEDGTAHHTHEPAPRLAPEGYSEASRGW